MPRKKTFKIATLGCRTNQYESEAYRKQLKDLGYRAASNQESADICIVNTCTVTSTADKKSLAQIRQLAKKNPNSRLFVTGCLAEKEKEKIYSIGGVENVVFNKEKESLIQKMFPEIETLPEFSIENFSAHTRAFVKVQDGCNSYCSYCIIPFVRGRSRSRYIPSICKEVEDLVHQGYREVVLTGINIGDFDGGDGKSNLADLVRIIDKVPGLERLRLSSIDPDEVDEDLIDAIANGQKTCPSMHIVLQSGSNAILSRMRRKYTTLDFFTAVENLKKGKPDFTFTTDVIVGFPGETDAHFAETVDVIQEVEFAKVHIFPYSMRPKTRASRFTDTVAQSVIEHRKKQLQTLADQSAYQLRKKYVGKKKTVLLESPVKGKHHTFSGHTDNFLEVHVEGKSLRSNEIVSVLLENNMSNHLKAIF